MSLARLIWCLSRQASICRKNGGHLRPQGRKKLRLKPWVFPHPPRISRTGMRQEHAFRPVRAPIAGDCAQGQSHRFGQMPRLRIPPQNHRQPHFAKRRQHPRAPKRGTFCARRQVTAPPRSGITEPHWDDGNLLGIAKGRLIETQPSAQSDTGSVIKHPPREMCPPSRGLPRDQDSRLRSDLKQRERPKRKIPTGLAGGNLGLQLSDVCV